MIFGSGGNCRIKSCGSGYIGAMVWMALPQYCVGAGCRIFWSSICLTGVGTYLFDQDLLIRVVSILPAGQNRRRRHGRYQVRKGRSPSSSCDWSLSFVGLITAVLGPVALSHELSLNLSYIQTLEKGKLSPCALGVARLAHPCWKAALLQSTTILAGAKIRTTAVACRPFAHCHHACAFATDQEAYLSTLYPLHLAQPVTRDTRRSVSVRDRSVVERAIH